MLLVCDVVEVQIQFLALRKCVVTVYTSGKYISDTTNPTSRRKVQIGK